MISGSEQKYKRKIDFRQVKQAAAGRWTQILPALTQLPSEVLKRGKQDHPCPLCGGDSTIWPSRDALETGSIACRKCTGNKPTGDGIATIAKFNGVSMLEAAKQVAGFLGIECDAQPVERDLIEEICRDKKMPIEAFRQFNPTIAKRGRSNLPVVRVATYNEHGEPSGYFDFAVGQKGWNGKGLEAGLFFPGRTPQPGETWLIVEGGKDAAALVGMGYLAAGLPMNVMAVKFARLFSGCDVVIVPDLDDAGQSGAQTTGGRLFGIASTVKVARLPGEIVAKGGDDVRDVIRQHGAERVKQAIESAEPWQPSEGRPDEEKEKPEITLTANLNFAVDMSSKYVGQLGWCSNWIPADKRERVKVYQRSGELVQVVTESEDTDIRGVILPAGTARIRPLPTAQLVLRIADSVKLIRESETESEGLVRKQVQPEKWLVDGVATRGYWEHVRKLEGITTSPTIRPDGSILQRAGWDQKTKLLYLPGKAKFDSVPESPSLSDAQSAVAELQEVVADFPFESDSDRSAWLAMVLTMIGRPAITGCCPLFAISATTRGSGKSLLADASSLIAYGRRAARKTYPAGDDNEIRKTITAVAMEALPAVLFDNLDCTLGGASLDAALTATSWTDRILGSNRTTGDLPLRIVWSATGNNLRFGSDIARRVLPIRLSPQIENPEERNDFKHSDLLGWVTHNRERLAVAVLKILRAYFVAGKPVQSGGQFGSFESWSEIVRGALVWAGCADPLTTREAAKADDLSAAIVAGLIGGLIEIDDNGDGITAREIAKRLNDESDSDKFKTMREVVSEIATSKGSIDSKRLGYQLRKYRGRVAKGWKVEGHPGHGGVIRWRSVKIETIDGGDGGDGGDGSTRSSNENGVCTFTNDTRHTRKAYGDQPEVCQPSQPSQPLYRVF
ncbi:MAG TPA: hypothetical protein PKA83_02800 [Pirellulaceae bacterium]|nr:hypothetical protein [Pirellulaceae bacterium]